MRRYCKGDISMCIIELDEFDCVRELCLLRIRRDNSLVILYIGNNLAGFSLV